MSLPRFRLETIPGETEYDWAARFFKLMAPEKTLLRKKDGSLWVRAPGHPPRRIATVEEFRGLVANIVSFIKSHRDGTEQVVPLPHDRAAILYYSCHQLILPPLGAVIYEPAVIPAGDGTYKLTPPGLDEVSGFCYWQAPPGSPIEPINGTRRLLECFSGVPFEKVEYRNNLLAWLLGAVLLDQAVEPPLLVVTGNRPGIGKSKTVEACGVIITGQAQVPVDQGAEEFEKQLGARFNDGQRFISIDNVVAGAGRSYKNERLARLLTSSFSKSVRVLGHSRSVEQQGVVFALSANNAKLDADLSTRSLPVKLYSEVSKPMSPYVIAYAKEHRRELYGELLGLALAPADPNITGVFDQFRFRGWLSFVYPRIKAAFGDLAIQESEELDDTVLELFSWGNDLPDGHSFGAQELIDAINAQRDRFPALYERFFSISSERQRKSSASKFLGSAAGHSLSFTPTLTLTLLQTRKYTTHQTPLFGFERRGE